MTIVPVIDLRGGRAVRGRSGARSTYLPVVSRVRRGAPENLSDPAALLQAYREVLRPDRVYVADLDRIEGQGDQRPVVEAMVEAAPEVSFLLDAGALSGADGRCPGPDGPVPVRGARLVPIVATETIGSLADLDEAGRRFGSRGAVFSLDLGERGVVSQSREVAATGERVLLRRARESGFRTAILLLLGGVGTGSGLPEDRLSRLRDAAPDLELLAGGGVASERDLAFLEGSGFAGALVGTALHEGLFGSGTQDSSRAPDGRRGVT